MALIQDLEDVKYYRVLYDNSSGSDLGIVTNFYEIPPFIQTEFHMLVLFNENILLEVDINRKEVVNESTISTFINKNKSDEKSKFFKHEYNLNTPNQFIYHVLTLSTEKKNPKFVWKFLNESIITVKFRPKNPNYNNEFTYQYKSFKNNTNLNSNLSTIPSSKQKLLKENHIAISFSSNRVCVFHYETKALIALFKSYYGSIVSLEYSFDGRLLAFGTESDQIYIVDPEYNVLLYCLEGHKNFVTNLTFFEEIVEEEEALEYSNYDSNRNDVKSDYNTNTIHALVNNKEMSIEEMMKIITIEENKSNIDIRQLRRARSSYMSKFIESDEMKSNITYDLYSSAMDGMIGVWRVEHFFEQHFVNEANYCSNFTTSNGALNNPFKLVDLFPHENLKIPYTSLTKVSTIPIVYHFINENSLVFIGKRNSRGSTVSMKFYYGNTKEEEEEVKDKTNYQPKEDSLQIRNKGRRDSVKITSNEEKEILWGGYFKD